MNIEEQKQKLIVEKQNIEKDLNNLGKSINNNGDWVVMPHNNSDEQADILDAANITEELEENIAVMNVLEQRYAQVEKALVAIEDGSYGTCDHGSCTINEDRLVAHPSATTCINHS